LKPSAENLYEAGARVRDPAGGELRWQHSGFGCWR
jgi:hypothetical protein